MAGTILDAVAVIQAKAIAAGAIAAPNVPPEAMSQFPFSVCYAAEGSVSADDATAKTGKHTLICEIHFARNLLPQAVALATPYIESMTNALVKDPTLGGNVANIIGDITYSFGYLDWGGIAEAHLGPQFRITVKMRSAIT